MIRFLLAILCLLGASNVFAETKEPEYIDIIQYESSTLKIPANVGMTNGNMVSVPVMKAETKRIEKSLFQKTIQNAIKELEGTLVGTCARKMTVALKIEASGKYAVAEIGIGGSIEVEILNPDLPKKCAK